jgi:hypothetical protein
MDRAAFLCCHLIFGFPEGEFFVLFLTSSSFVRESRSSRQLFSRLSVGSMDVFEPASAFGVETAPPACELRRGAEATIPPTTVGPTAGNSFGEEARQCSFFLFGGEARKRIHAVEDAMHRSVLRVCGNIWKFLK